MSTGDLIEDEPLTKRAVASYCPVNLGCALFDLRKRA
jgi:hypothetical protein